MTYTKNNTFNTDNLLRIPENQEYSEGIVWSISLIWERKLTNLRTDIEKGILKKEVEEAKEREQSILEYLGIDTYLGIDISKRERKPFSVVFSLSEENVHIEQDFYRDLLILYILKYPDISDELIQSWITEQKNIVIELGVSQDKSSYFIRTIRIEDAPKKNGE